MTTWPDSFADSSGGAESRQPPIFGPLAKPSKGKVLATRGPRPPAAQWAGRPTGSVAYPIRYRPHQEHETMPVTEAPHKGPLTRMGLRVARQGTWRD